MGARTASHRPDRIGFCNEHLRPRTLHGNPLFSGTDEVMHSDANFVRVEGLFAEQTGYATPKVDVRGAVIEDGRILLVREVADSGRWTMPDGWADVNQSPSECVIRQLREERARTDEW